MSSIFMLSDTPNCGIYNCNMFTKQATDQQKKYIQQPNGWAYKEWVNLSQKGFIELFLVSMEAGAYSRINPFSLAWKFIRIEERDSSLTYSLKTIVRATISSFYIPIVSDKEKKSFAAWTTSSDSPKKTFFGCPAWLFWTSKLCLFLCWFQLFLVYSHICELWWSWPKWTTLKY